MALEELNRLLEDEILFYRDLKTQYVDYKFKKVVVCSSNSDFLFPLLYDLYTGSPFGIHAVIEVVILVEEEKISSLERLYCDFMTGGLPKFRDLRLSSKLDDMKKADIVIIYPDISFGTKETPKSRKEVLCEQFPLLRKLGTGIDKYLPRKSLVFLLGECLSPVRFIVGMYSGTFPHQNIHGIVRHYERQAAAILASRLKVPMREVKGLGVFGEDIVEVTNGWIEYDVADLEDDYYEESLLYYKTDVYQLLKKEEKRKTDLIEKLTGSKNIGLIDIPDLSQLQFCEVEEPQDEPILAENLEEGFQINDEGLIKSEFSYEGNEHGLFEHEYEFNEEEFPIEPSDVRIHDGQMGDNQKFEKKRMTEEELEEWMNERFPDRTRREADQSKEKQPEPFTMCERLRESWTRHWLSRVTRGIHELPEEWNVDNCMSRLLHDKPPLRDNKWILARINDERFFKYSIPTKSKEVQNSYTLARSVIDYIDLLFKKKSRKRTSALVCSPGIYSVTPGIFSSFPVIIDKGNVPSIIDGYEISEATYLRIKNQVKCLEKEYDLVLKLFRAFPPEQPAEIQPEVDLEECTPEMEEGLIYDIVHDENISGPKKQKK